MKPKKYSSASLHFCAPSAAFVAVFIALSCSANAQALNWLGGNTTNASWNAAGNMSALIGSGSSTTDVTFNNLTRAITNDTGASRIVRSLTYGTAIASAFTTNMTSSSVLTFQAASGNASINVNSLATGNITFNGGAGFTGYQSLASQLDVTHNGSGLLLFNRQFAGAGGITKLGSGTMQISAPNTNSFTGAVNVNAGRLIMGSTATATGDLNTSSGITLGGGILEIRTTSALDKSINPSLTVSSASTLAYNNTAATNQSMTLQTGAMVLNANLTVQNISSSGAGNNIINITRNLTGSGNLIVDTYNNVASGAVSFSNGRVQLSGDNSAWTGNLIVAKGTAQFSGTNSFVPTAGSITLGTTGDAFGAALGFNQASTNATLSNAITVTTGGTRLIRNNAGPGSTNNITLDGALQLDGTLTVDHAGLGAGKSITISGNAAGAGGLTITFVGANPIADSSVLLTGTNIYTGATSVTSGRLVVAGTIGNSAVTVSGAGTVLATDAAASFGSTIAINNGAILAAGDAGAAGTATVTGATTFNNGAIFSWDINATGTSYDKLVSASLVDGDAAGGSVLRIVASDADFINTFWDTTRTWTDIFTTNGSAALTNWANIFTNVTVVNSSFETITPMDGSFSVSGNTLTWSAVPEPTSALAGLLLAGGLLRRRRSA